MKTTARHEAEFTVGDTVQVRYALRRDGSWPRATRRVEKVEAGGWLVLENYGSVHALDVELVALAATVSR